MYRKWAYYAKDDSLDTIDDIFNHILEDKKILDMAEEIEEQIEDEVLKEDDTKKEKHKSKTHSTRFKRRRYRRLLYTSNYYRYYGLLDKIKKWGDKIVNGLISIVENVEEHTIGALKKLLAKAVIKIVTMFDKRKKEQGEKKFEQEQKDIVETVKQNQEEIMKGVEERTKSSLLEKISNRLSKFLPKNKKAKFFFDLSVLIFSIIMSAAHEVGGFYYLFSISFSLARGGITLDIINRVAMWLSKFIAKIVSVVTVKYFFVSVALYIITAILVIFILMEVFSFICSYYHLSGCKHGHHEKDKKEEKKQEDQRNEKKEETKDKKHSRLALLKRYAKDENKEKDKDKDNIEDINNVSLGDILEELEDELNTHQNDLLKDVDEILEEAEKEADKIEEAPKKEDKNK